MKNVIACLMAFVFSCVTSFAQDTKTDLYADNIIIVFDASASMGDSIGTGDRSIKIAVAKSSLRQVVAKLRDNTNIGLFVFGNVSNTNPVPIAPKNVKNLNYAIDNIKDGGGTPLGEFIEKAANQLLQQRQKNLGYGRYKILVVTDGEATDRNKMASVAPEVLKRNLSLDVIGVGMTSEHQLAKMSTSYRAANDTDALNKALQDIVAETPAKVKDVSGSDNDFDLIKGLSDEQAKTIILTLGNTENQPLFEKPKAFEIEAPQSTENVTSQNSAATAFPVFTLVTTLLAIIVFVFIIYSMCRI